MEEKTTIEELEQIKKAYNINLIDAIAVDALGEVWEFNGYGGAYIFNNWRTNAGEFEVTFSINYTLGEGYKFTPELEPVENEIIKTIIERAEPSSIEDYKRCIDDARDVLNCLTVKVNEYAEYMADVMQGFVNDFDDGARLYLSLSV